MCKPNKEYRMREKEEDGFDYDCIKNGDLCVLPYCSCYQGYLLLVRISKDHFAADWRFFLFFFACACACFRRKESDTNLSRKKIKYVGIGCPMCTMQAKQKGLLGSFLMNNIKDPPSSPVKDSSFTSLVFLFPSSPPEGSFLFHLSTSLYIFPSIFNSA